MVLSAGLGQYNIPIDQVVASVGRRLGLAPENPAMQLADSTLWNIRFPRVLLGVLVGAALGTSGAVMQSVFGNPLAEPGVIGVSSGAAVGACLSIVLNLQFFGILRLLHSRLWVRWRLLHWCISCRVLRAARRFCR